MHRSTPRRRSASLVESQAFGAPLRVLTGRYGDHCYQPHQHDEYTLSVVETGSLRSSMHGRELQAGPNDVVVIPPQWVHDGRNGTPAGFGYRVLYLHPQTLLRAAGNGELPLREGAYADPALAAALRRAHAGLLSAGDVQLGAEEAVLAFIETLRTECPPLAPQTISTSGARAAAPGRPNAALHPGIRRVRDQLQECPQENPSLDELAAAAGLSRRHLTRLFRQELGLSVHRFQMQAKLKAAYRLLRGGEAAASTAALLGFTDQAHLTRCFWAVFGVSPGMAARTG